MPKFKIKFSDKVVRKNHNHHSDSSTIRRVFKPNNFIFHMKEVPGVHLTFYRMSRKEATNRALSMAPGCTFNVEEFHLPHA